MVGSVLLHVMACGKASVIRLTEVYFALLLTRNIVSYEKLEQKGYGIKYKDNRRALISLTTGGTVFDMAMCNNVLVLEMKDEKVDVGMVGTVLAALDEALKQGDDGVVHKGTLMHFH